MGKLIIERPDGSSIIIGEKNQCVTEVFVTTKITESLNNRVQVVNNPNEVLVGDIVIDTSQDYTDVVATTEYIDTQISAMGSQIKDIENKIGDSKTIDLVMFMGQSNMAGRGVANESPTVPLGHGFEFRAISDNTRLYDVIEPFGIDENNPSGINEPGMKTGSMVSSFIINYYNITKIPIVGVSASKGGSSINEWQPNGAFLNDSINRFQNAVNFLNSNGYTIRHKFMVWCQGETDGDNSMDKIEYISKVKLMIEEMCNQGVEKCFIVRIGNHRDDENRYNNIIQAQTELCKTYDKAILVSTKFDSMANDGLMKDEFHYKQEGYNVVGKDAGINTSYYINNLKEPTMYDWENDSLYVGYNVENINNKKGDIIFNFYSENENGLEDIEKCGKTAMGRIKISESNMGYKKMLKQFIISGSANWTIEFKVHPSQLVQDSINGDVNTVQTGIILANDNGTLESITNFLFINNHLGFIRLRATDSSTQIDFNVEKSILDEEHLYSIVCDCTNAKLYIDGVLHSTVPSATLPTTIFTHMFGGYKNPVAPKNGYNYKGICSYIGLFNRTLSEDEIG